MRHNVAFVMKQMVTSSIIVLLTLTAVLVAGCTQTSNTDAQGFVHDSRLEGYSIFYTKRYKKSTLKT